MKHHLRHHPTEDLVPFVEGSLAPERQQEIQAHLDVCETCRDQLDQCRSDEEFLKRFTPLNESDAEEFPAAIDALVLPRLEKHLTSQPARGRTKFQPKRNPSNPDAPVIPGFALLHKLGEGSFGVVWKAEDDVGRFRAIKVLNRDRKAEYDVDGLKRALLGGLPHSVSVGEVKLPEVGTWYYVMDYVPETLAARLKAKGRFPSEEAREIIIRLLEVLGDCHRAELAHRDIKPENIGFTEAGKLVLLDLGLVTEANRTNRTLVGTPDFMPHKPAKVPRLDDLYAAGVILYCLITGEKPTADIPAKPSVALANRGLGLQLYKAARTAAAPNPCDRFQSAAEFLEAVSPIRRTKNSGSLRRKRHPAAAETAPSTRLGREISNTIARGIEGTVKAIERAVDKGNTPVGRTEEPSAKSLTPPNAERFQEIAGKLGRSGGRWLATITSKLRVRTTGQAGMNKRAANAEDEQTTIQKQTNIMNSTQQLLTEAATVLGDIGLTQRQQTLRQEAEKLVRPKYKVAVIGQFKVGKSNLINHVLLKEPVLFTDIHAATAVPTEIEFGAEPLLEVYPHLLAAETLSLPEGGKSATVEVAWGEGTPEIIRNPTPSDIKARTSASDQDPVVAREKRTALAKHTARVHLTWPAKELGGYTIVDTPGINEVNEAVVATTYRVIPEADVTVFVKRDEALGQVEKTFLRSRVFESGVSRCLMVVNAGGQGNAKPASQLDHVMRMIRADLRSIGRDYVPVESVLLPCPTDDPRKSLTSATPDEQASIEKFGQSLQKFLADNVEPGRQERSRAVLTREAQLGRTEAQVELSTLHKTPEELAELERKLAHEGREFKRRYRRVGQEFLNDLKTVQHEHYASLATGLDTVASEYGEGFSACASLNEVQVRLQQADQFLRPKVEELFFRTSDESLRHIRDLEKKYQADFEQEARSWLQGVEREFKLEGGLLTKLPTVLVLALDVIITHMLLPGGWIIAILERWILTKIPVVRDFLPSSILRQMAINYVRRHVTEQFSDCKDEIRTRINDAYREAGQRLTEAWEDSSEEQLQVVIGPLNRALKESKNPVREAELKRAIAALDAILTQIQ